MGTISWTEAQLEAIEAKGNNVLVSAAAGSGKTAVLVERVIRMLTRREDPRDIDRLVVVTFTRAAAAQMKSKIEKALRKVLETEPRNAHLRQQLMKVQNARICTIDALCGEIARDHFQDIDLDPGFRMADSGQIKMMQKEVLANLLEEKYKEGSEDFLTLADYYTDKSDRQLENIVLTLFSYAQSHPEPEVWLRSITIPYQKAKTLFSDEDGLTYPEGMEDWLPVFGEVINEQLDEIRAKAEAGWRICQMDMGPAPLEPIFQGILEKLDEISRLHFDGRKKIIEEFLEQWPKAPTVSTRNGDVDEELKKLAVKYRKEIKEALEKLIKESMYKDLEGLFLEIADCLPAARAISELTLEFSEAYAREKKEKKIAEFSDIAHEALRVLIRYDENGAILRDENGNPLYTEVADQMARQIDEVIVDEYQDTNMLQDYLVRALSGERFGKPDVFMVGDVKQSIYGFRMACPELFNEKMKLYRGEAGVLVNLDRNFRSCREVLEVTNKVFSQIMIPEVGDIDYRDGHALCFGAEEAYGTAETSESTASAADPEQGGSAGTGDGTVRSYIPEILLMKGSGEEGKTQEAYRIAQRIEELVSGEGYHFSDIVILVRTSNNPELEKILYQRGIPVIKNTGEGFFDSFEVRLVLDLLQVVDNPLQDIPLAAVLYSPLCGASAQDLAKIRLAGGKNASLYECLCRYVEERYPCGNGEVRGESVDADETGTGESLHWLLEKLEVWQERSAYLSLNDFLAYILEDSGLNRIIAAMPQGEDRRANLEFLKTRAEAFAKGTYAGLFQFLRYIKELQDNDEDFPNAVASQDAECVRIMTIHHSKGLEFKVVILALTGKTFNEMDLNSSGIIPSRSLGVGIEYRDPRRKMVNKTILMQTIRKRRKRELYAEEMRLLYVAMTRAMEKLIITGTDYHLDSAIKGWEESMMFPGQVRRSWQIMRGSSFLKLLGLALHPFSDEKDLMQLEYADEKEAEEERAVELLENRSLQEEIRKLALEDIDVSKIKEQCEYAYPYENATQILVKLTASSLEKRDVNREADAQKEDAGISEKQKGVQNKIDTKGKDIVKKAKLRKNRSVESEEEQEALVGAERGNAYHKFLELYDYSNPDIREQLDSLLAQGRMSPEACASVDEEKIRTFLDSAIGQRMARAFRRGQLMREKQFVMGYSENVNSGETLTGPKQKSDLEDQELLLVQGVIDAWFVEEAEDRHIILVDYKTDKMTDEQYFRDTFSPQLRVYADVLERCTGLKVTEQIIYSLELGREIVLS